MSVNFEKLDNNMARLTIEVSLDKIEEAVNKVYQRQRNRISLPGFRKGKAPRKMIERMYGAAVFLEDAANDLLPKAYNDAVQEIGKALEIVSQPKVEVTQLEPGKPMVFTAEVAVKPEVTLGEYKGMEVPKQDTTVTDEEVDEAIKREQDKNGRTVEVEDRGAENGDTVVLDYAGFTGEEQFQGGTAQDQRLELGSGTFIPGFEEQLVGVKAGEHAEVKVTFPEEYHEKSLAGKEAVFQCEIKKVETKELPELNDEFAQDVSEFDTFEEYKNHVREDLEKTKADNARRAKESAAVEKAVANAQMDIPDLMVESRARQIVDDFAQRMQMQGLSMEQYFQFTGQTMDKMREDAKEEALRQIKNTLVMEKIAEVENIEVTDEDIDAELASQAQAYGLETDKIREMMGEDGLETRKNDLAAQKAVALVGDAAVETEE